MRLNEFISSKGRGGQAWLAEAICSHAPDVSMWLDPNSGRQPAPHMCVRIERATIGAVTVEEIRPDVRWKRVKQKGWPNPAGYPYVDAESLREKVTA